MTRKWLVYMLAGWSGFFVMSVEILSGRILAPDFGSSIYVWGAVITVFMLALATGYLLGGYLSLFSPTLKRLGALLILAAATLLPLIALGEPILDWVFTHVHDPRYGSLIGSTILFFVPTAISGAVSPYAIRLLVTELQESGKSAGSLYFVSTLGSAAGTIITSFYLVLSFEINQILLALSAISIYSGCVAIVLAQKR